MLTAGKSEPICLKTVIKPAIYELSEALKLQLPEALPPR
jgi:hypothetical protein